MGVDLLCKRLLLNRNLVALLSMATYVRNVRKYWKRYLLCTGIFYFTSRFLIKRYRSV